MVCFAHRDYELHKNAKNTNNFVQAATLRHGDKYSYIETRYHTPDTIIEIKCKQHGNLYQLPQIHLLNYDNCIICIEQNIHTTTF